jgi:hypothetical protein
VDALYILEALVEQKKKRKYVPKKRETNTFSLWKYAQGACQKKEKKKRIKKLPSPCGRAPYPRGACQTAS